MELISNFTDVSGNNHKVTVGEADQYITVTVPGQADGKEQLYSTETSSLVSY